MITQMPLGVETWDFRRLRTYRDSLYAAGQPVSADVDMALCGMMHRAIIREAEQEVFGPLAPVAIDPPRRTFWDWMEEADAVLAKGFRVGFAALLWLLIVAACLWLVGKW